MLKKKHLLKLLLVIPAVVWAFIVMVAGGRLENETIPVVERYLLKIGVSMTAFNIIAVAIFIAPILWYVWSVRKDKKPTPLKPDEEESVRKVRAKKEGNI